MQKLNPKEDSVLIAVRVPKSWNDKIKFLSNQKSITPSKFLRETISRKIKLK